MEIDKVLDLMIEDKTIGLSKAKKEALDFNLQTTCFNTDLLENLSKIKTNVSYINNK